MSAVAESKTELYAFSDQGGFPNSALPLLVVRGALAPAADLADAFEALFARHGWTNGWRNGIYDFDHFHSTTHEVMGLARGRAEVRFGGPNGRIVSVACGDVAVLPAGLAHRLEEASEDLCVVGAYPDGREWDVRRGDPAERHQVIANLLRVPLPRFDPVSGGEGPLIEAWRSKAV